MLVSIVTSVTGAWHFLQTGTSRYFLALLFFPPFHHSFLGHYLLCFIPQSFLEMSKLTANLPLPLSEFLFILTAPLPPCSIYRSISLSSPSDSASPHHFLCLHASSSFCSLPV
ncbi:hypothetical protein AMECASPLE_024807 [Ameca splendens]|uniref:Uncharacterized protein n=1 Tax=Ameca splendens TaxID=208324 RepID=A0ABV1A0T4_9TELE